MNITGVPHKIKLTLNPADTYVLGTWFLPMCIHPTTVHERVRVSILREVAVRFEKKLISVPKQQVTMQLVITSYSIHYTKLYETALGLIFYLIKQVITIMLMP